ncbi:glycoside hydrolase family 51 protein [Mycena sp. CBHHK59/15]|nr:glycoside hydrolase family 51 protein [Mycena sp. CBHHK59/15]
MLLTVLSILASLTVSATASHPIPTTLCQSSFFTSGDGGLYAEMLQNRAFQQVTPGTSAALNAWHSINGAALTVVADSVPLSSALPNALQLTIPAGRTGAVGVGNEGYWGVNVVSGSTYKASFYYRFPTASTFKGNVTVGLQTSTGASLVSSSVPINGATTSWTQVNVALQPKTSAASTANNFTVTFDGAAASGQTVHFGFFSLFPPTFKDRPNGMRVDIATVRIDFSSSHLDLRRVATERAPGGWFNQKGQTVATRWQWNATVGPLINRPGRQGDWGYVNTDGLGLMEYLNWCEDLGMQPIMAVWSGFALGGTTALRASLGHPAPFALNYVEVGNEDFFASSTYPYRWHDFVTALTAEFPNCVHFIATTDTFNPLLSPNPLQYDVHVYQTPTWFAQNSFFYDGFQGEYAAISTNSSDIFGSTANGRLTFPTMQSASGEAAFMTGLERNSDIVFSASYAPLLNTPNLVSFDAGGVYRSTSFYAQKLFSLNRGDEYIPSTLPTPSGTLFWSVVRKTSTQQIIIKISNTVGTAAPITFVLPFATVAPAGTAQVLTGAATASNTPTAPNRVVPKNSTITTGKTFTYTAPAFSVNVITVVAH